MKDEHIAIVRGLDLPISMKISSEICKFIKGKNLIKAKAQLEQVLEQKIAIPYTRYHREVSHKPGKGLGAGRYPVKTTKHFIQLLDSLQANAENKGLNTENLVIDFASANQGPKIWHSSRHRGRRMKRAHVELRVKEEEKVKEKKK